MSTKKQTAKKTSKKETSKDPLEELESEETTGKGKDQSGVEEGDNSVARGNVSGKARVHQPTVKTEQNTPEPQEEKEEEAPKPIVEQPKTFSASQQSENIGVTYQRKAHQMKEILEKQPKVAFMIPKQEGDGDGAFDTVQINGFRIEIKKGVMVNIPQQCAEILADKYRIHAEAGNQFRLNRNDRVEDALS